MAIKVKKSALALAKLDGGKKRSGAPKKKTRGKCNENLVEAIN